MDWAFPCWWLGVLVWKTTLPESVKGPSACVQAGDEAWMCPAFVSSMDRAFKDLCHAEQQMCPHSRSARSFKRDDFDLFYSFPLTVTEQIRCR